MTVMRRRCFSRHSCRMPSASSESLILTTRSPVRISRMSPAHCRFQASTAPPGRTASTIRHLPSSAQRISRPSGTLSARRSVSLKVGEGATAALVSGTAGRDPCRRSGLDGDDGSLPVPPEAADSRRAAASVMVSRGTGMVGRPSSSSSSATVGSGGVVLSGVVAAGGGGGAVAGGADTDDGGSAGEGPVGIASSPPSQFIVGEGGFCASPLGGLGASAASREPPGTFGGSQPALL
mmetsp:Transcript_44068/g.130493  ORF Transcript_44068/g.130493 Transcript_44068/m.130493 type:complete len:236 (-) Transcript_44068:541-1248(-)